MDNGNDTQVPCLTYRFLARFAVLGAYCFGSCWRAGAWRCGGGERWM